MFPHIGSELTSIGELFTSSALNGSEGWTSDYWCPSPLAVDRIVEAYERLIRPVDLADSIDTLLNGLNADGVPIEQIIGTLPPIVERQRQNVIRADMIEIAAAASIIASNHLELGLVSMPNVPKASPNQSAPGIDMIALRLDALVPPDVIGKDDLLIITSIKHTIQDINDVRRKLIKSISPLELSIAYVSWQLRAYHGRMLERGYEVSKAFSIFKKLVRGEPGNHQLVAVAGVDDTNMDQISDQCGLLGEFRSGSRHFRWILFPQISELHSLVTP